MLSAEIVSAGIDKAGVVKDRAAHSGNDRHRRLDREAGERLAANRLAVFILRSDVAEVEAAQIICAAEEEAIEKWHVIAIAPDVDRANFAVQGQNNIEWEKKILRALEIEPVVLRVAAKEPAGNLGRENDPVSVAGKEDTVARVPKDGRADLALQPVRRLPS